MAAIYTPNSQKSLGGFIKEIIDKNSMGNCSLLLRSHNRSKNDEQFYDFLWDVFDKDKTQIDEFKKALNFDDCLLSPDSQSIEDIIKSIDTRTDLIKGGLKKYFNDGINREDV